MIEDWGTAPDGTCVKRVTLFKGGLRLHVLTYGATVQGLYVPEVPHSLVLGYDSFAPYATNPNYYGATVGRYANRIAEGRFQLNGETVQLDRNQDGQHHLHGGRAGASFRNWEIAEVSAQELVLQDVLPDGHMGYPGELTVRARFTLLSGRELSVSYESRTDKATVCNFAPHCYFTLDGSEDLRHHALRVAAHGYLAVTAQGIPTGDALPVEGTGYDFRRMRSLAEAGGIVALDTNFCLERAEGDLTFAAKLTSKRSPVSLEVFTSEPGLQVYTARHLTDRPAFAGIALEPQIWPDAPNRPDFMSAELRPGETRRQVTRFVLGEMRTV